MWRITPKINDEKICNFDIIIHRLVNIHTDAQQKGVPYAEISMVSENGTSREKQRVALSTLADIDWSQLDYRVIFEQRFSIAKARRCIADAIRSALGNIPEIDVYRLSDTGLHKINGEPMFCTGREIIRSPSGAARGTEVECACMPQRIDVDPNLSESEAVAGIVNLISLFPNPGRIVLSQVLVALMRQAYEDAGKAPNFCVFLHGDSGTQKTTIAGFLTQLYNRSDGIIEPTRLNVSRASAVEMLMDVADQVKVFDDLFPADSAQVRKNQEETFFEITRYIGDGTIPARMTGHRVREGRPKCGVLFTGEYLIGRGSDAARLLPVRMTKPDTYDLKYFQERPLIVSTFYRNFISWFIENYDEIVLYLKEWLDEYRKTDLGVHDRLREAHFFLNTAYSLLLQYCKVRGVLSDEDSLRFHSSFVEMLTHLVREQNERVSPTASAASVQGDYLERIKELYRGNQLSITQDKCQFDDRRHDGVIHGRCLCLRPQALSRIFPSSDVHDIAHNLEIKGALIKSKDGLTKKISALHGKHYYWIPLSSL